MTQGTSSTTRNGWTQVSCPLISDDLIYKRETSGAVVAHTFDLSTWEAEQLDLLSEWRVVDWRDGPVVKSIYYSYKEPKF